MSILELGSILQNQQKPGRECQSMSFCNSEFSGQAHCFDAYFPCERCRELRDAQCPVVLRQARRFEVVTHDEELKGTWPVGWTAQLKVMG